MNERNISKIIIWPTKNVTKIREEKGQHTSTRRFPSDRRELTVEWLGYTIDWTAWQVSLSPPNFDGRRKRKGFCWGVGRFEHISKGQGKFFGILLVNTNNMKTIFQQIWGIWGISSKKEANFISKAIKLILSLSTKQK